MAMSSCTITSVDQPQTDVSVTTSFAGDSYDTPVTTTTAATVTEPTILTVNTATGEYAESTTVSGVLKDANTNTPIAGEPVTFQLNGTETCTGDDRFDGHRHVHDHARRSGGHVHADRDLRR